MGKKALILLSGVWFLACSDKTATMEHAYTNDLIKESSPYLLQHAHNPVDWKPWNDEVLAQAQKENKPILISIGYASCHWCHVMEEECFEDLEVARIMNEHFINIKIDREERPDVDQVYMDALQLLTGRGGWPLNVVALPNGKPYWGATYLPKDQWISALTQLSELYEKDPGKIEEYAGKLSSGVKAMQLIEPSAKESVLTPNALDALVEDWQQYFDSFLGGYKRAPKFMMPNNLDFLMHYGFLREQDSILQYVNTSLTRMAYGGLFDPIDGGFSRYSVDTKWHVPHFEKMLYDNGQLISLYAKAYALTKNPLYKQTVVKTIAFVEEQLGSSEGGYYSSLDADSFNKSGELEEGAFYVWKESELKDLLGDLYEVFAAYYNVNSYGHWENGNYVLIRDHSDEHIAEKFSLSVPELESQIQAALKRLKQARDLRPKPRLDDKILTSWNALYLQGLVDASRYLQNDEYLKKALGLGRFLQKNLKQEEGGLYRNFKENQASIPAFLDDYAALIEAYISLYEMSGETEWLEESEQLLSYCNTYFGTAENDLYFYTDKQSAPLIRRSIEVSDNVISASNSIMMLNLQRLGKIYSKPVYRKRAAAMLQRMHPQIQSHAQGHANWLHGLLHEQEEYFEIAIVGNDAESLAKDLGRHYLPNSILLWEDTESEDSSPLIQDRWVSDQTLIYVCIEGSCKLPVQETKEALAQLGNPYTP